MRKYENKQQAQNKATFPVQHKSNFGPVQNVKLQKQPIIKQFEESCCKYGSLESLFSNPKQKPTNKIFTIKKNYAI